MKQSIPTEGRLRIFSLFSNEVQAITFLSLCAELILPKAKLLSLS